MKEQIAIYPGSFDPITMGHLDIIERSSKIFDKIIVVVMSNYKKKGLHAFSVEERMEFIRKSVAHLNNVSVDSYMGLLAEYAKDTGAVAIVKGLRAVSDFEDEFQQALINKKLNPEVDTVFLAASAENMFLSSSMLKQVCALGGDIERFLPKAISQEIIEKLTKG